MAGWQIQSVNELFGAQAHDSVPDQTIIPRCAAEGLAWVTADDSARREHEFALKSNLVSVLWVKRPKDGMSVAYSFAVLATALLRFDRILDDHPGRAMHCAVGHALSARVDPIWEQRRPR